MNKQEQREAIAEVCGFTEEEPWCDGRRCWHFKEDPSHVGREEIPDYCYDLNAMHEAEKVLMERLDHWWDYHTELKALKIMSEYGKGGTIHATAAQRAEAFLKTLNLWKKS